MDEEVWFDVPDALHELSQLAQVEALFMEKAWEEEFFARDRMKEFISDDGLHITDEDLNDYAKSRSFEVEMLRQTYLRAHLIMAYGIFEKGLASLARHAYSSLKGEQPPKRKGAQSAFEYSRDMLRDYCGVDRTFQSDDWGKADKIRRIRNVFVHSAALLDDPRDINDLTGWQAEFLGVSSRPFGGESSNLLQLWVETFFVRYTHDVFVAVLSEAMNELGDPIDAAA